MRRPPTPCSTPSWRPASSCAIRETRPSHWDRRWYRSVPRRRLDQRPSFPTLSDEMERVARQLDRQCLATAIVGNELVILAAVGPPGPMGLTVSVGHRFPFAPPIGAVFLSSASDAEIRDWLVNGNTPPESNPVDLFYHAVRSVRKRGYSVGLSDAFSQRRLMETVLATVDTWGPARRRRAHSAPQDRRAIRSQGLEAQPGLPGQPCGRTDIRERRVCHSGPPRHLLR